MKTQNLEVIELSPNGPAALAGIRIGDDITAVEGREPIYKPAGGFGSRA